MKGLSERQKEVLEHIRTTLALTGRAPTLREIATPLGISPQAVRDTVMALEKKGYVTREEGKTRSLMLAAAEREEAMARPCPFYPEEPLPSPSLLPSPSTIWLPLSYPEGTFAFRVTSWSMSGAGILPGDIAIVSPSSDIPDDAVVLASPTQGSGRMELRRLRRTARFLELWPENDSMGIIRSQSMDFHGILIEIRRKY